MFKNIVFLLAAALGGELQATELLKVTESWDGGTFSYPVGKPEVTSFKLSLEEGKKTPFHCHPVPTMGYVLEGEIEVTTGSGKKQIFKAGQSVVEVMSTVHQGRAINGPVEIVVFYAGEVGTPNTILEGHKHYSKHCK